MNLKELKTILDGVGIPVAYQYFPEDEPQKPPYICYRVTGDNNFAADGVVYQKVDRIAIELYTKNKDEALEGKVEEALSSFVWTKEEEYLTKERIYQIVYEIEV